MLWSLNINYDGVDHVLCLNYRTWWDERLGLKHPGLLEMGRMEKTPVWQMKTWQETCQQCLEQPGMEGGAGEWTPLGFSCYTAIAGPQRGVCIRTA